MFRKNKYLEKCKKVFNDDRLELYKNKYPICREDLSERKKKYKNGYKGFITEEQLEVADFYIENNIPIYLEYKINAPVYGDFWLDIYAKGRWHFFGEEVDGSHHYTRKSQIKRDALKEKIIFDRHGIFTDRIKNSEVNSRKALAKNLEMLNTRLYTKKNEHTFKGEWLGDLICNICNAKSKK